MRACISRGRGGTQLGPGGALLGLKAFELGGKRGQLDRQCLEPIAELAPHALPGAHEPLEHARVTSAICTVSFIFTAARP